MRHNLVIVLLFVLASPAFGERPRADQARKPATEAPKPDKRLEEIDRSWMQTIHAGKPPAETNTNPATAEKSDDPNRLLNPGPNASEGRNETASEGNANPSTPQNPGTTATQPQPPQSLFPEEDRPSFVSTLVRFLGMFVLMIGAFYGVMRYLKSKSVGGNMGELATTLGSVALAPGKHLQVVDLAGKILVLGVSDAGVQLVTEVEDARTAERIRIWHSSKPVIPTPENLLQKALLAFKGSDLKFWNKREPSTPSFREHLDTMIPRTRESREELLAETATPAAEQNDLFQTEDNLRSLIRDQKNRLAKLKETGVRKRRDAGELAPET
ncbi:MAG: flagellar biosynthetic protein FliO [Leptospirales bacterium]|nr:flagellar biosynthetic protein FliO [Leptospirales bacterium]